jgi:hypothetical protein
MQRSVNKQTRVSRWHLPDIMGVGGAVSGLLAGGVMVLLSPLLSLLTGIGIWEPPKLIAATVLGPSAIAEPGFVIGPVLIGTLLHFVTAVVLGTIFGIVFHRLLHLTTSFGLPAMIGLCYGLLIFIIAFFVILPYANPTLRDSDMVPVLVQNIVFGIFLGLFYTLVRPEPYSD